MLPAVILLVLSLVVPVQQNPSELFYQSIRNNDLARLRALVDEHGAVTKDSRGQTPLMLAAAFGSFEATKLLIDAGADVKAASPSGLTALHLCVGDIRKVRLLIDQGADVHARSQMGRTPLLVAAITNGASEAVKLLLDKGAVVNAPDAAGMTPLIASAFVNETATAKLLIERGADINARAEVGPLATALMAAAANGNAELTRLLLARKASVNVVSAAGGATVKNGIVQTGSLTALHHAVIGGNAEVVKMLLEAGAEVDTPDVRGMTPLMSAVSTDWPNPRIVRMLLDKGSDTSVRSKAGETALDWAREFNHPGVLSELKLKAAPVATPPSRIPLTRADTGSRAAVERSMPLLKRSAEGMLSNGGCIACHAQPLAQMAAMLARERGWQAEDPFSAESLQTLRTRWMLADQPLLQGGAAPPGEPALMIYSSLALAAAGEPASWNTDVLVHSLAARQRAEGNWRAVGAPKRPPIGGGDFQVTALSIRALTVYGMPGRKAEMEERIQRAARWLAAESPLTTQDRIMQLLGLKWAGANATVWETRKRELIALQRSDGGWAQTPYLPSDAYATGQVLYALREAGVPSSDAAFRRGVEFLLRTQRDDGSWYVKSRSPKIQPYFESGFPHGHNQWISSAATAWAAMALSRAEPELKAAAVGPPAN